MKLYDLIRQNRNEFSDDFVMWLPSNMHIWQAFVNEAIKIYELDFKHYSARTIIHFLRHHSAIKEKGSEWKINNNHSPYLGRLFDLAYPHMAGLFTHRVVSRAQWDAIKRGDI